MKVGIVEHIDCAHFLPGHPKCGTLHGHTYKIEIVVEGVIANGMVVDFSDLKTSAREVLSTYDHKSWNDALDYPSVENICMLLNSRLREKLPFPFSLKVWEGEGKWAEL
jgi:6-pyruvoyltetrahydropterin/6-carboxytetrahydropterin synthase